MTPAPMPELPEAAFVRVIPPAHYKDTETTVPLYTAAQMHAYARAYAAGMAGDAARYRWLAESAEVKVEKREWQEYLGENKKGQHIYEDRKEVFWHYIIEPILSGTVDDTSTVPSLDAAIDAAMKENDDGR